MSGETGVSLAEWPEPLGEAAFHGLAGEVVRTIDPHTEADPAAVLIQFLVAVGSAIGRGAGFEAESTRHATNLYALIVGQTSKGRKGSSWQQARRPIELADPTWAERVVSGISSGEGLIHVVRDPVEKRRKAKKTEPDRADEDGYITEIEDEGAGDKRVLAYESEFASVLRVMRRDGSTTGMVIRQAWESGDLNTLTRNNPLSASNTHISIVGHIVQEELRRELTRTDAASGFGNRFLFVCARRSKSLPEGGSLTDEDWQEIAPEIRDAIRFGGIADVLERDDEARVLWADAYGRLSEGAPGLYGAITSRSEAQVMRLAVIYAILDQASRIRAEHLQAALAAWDYCEASARCIFGDALGDETADTILARLQAAGQAGLTRTQIRDLFNRHKPVSETERALSLLASLGFARETSLPTGGRSAKAWIATAFLGDRSDESDRSRVGSGVRSHWSLPSPPNEERDSSATPEEPAGYADAGVPK
jgi:hypothetical protein